MPSNRILKWGGALIVLLIVANVLNQIYWNWGLITVKVRNAPLSKVIKSIEWQGWVKIYTNLPPDTQVSMYVDHVPLAEAMETLAANVGGPPMGVDRPRDGGGNGPGGNPPPANPSGATPPDATANNTNAPAGAPPAAPGGPGGPGGFAGGGPGGGGSGGRGGRGGFGGGGFGGGATWNLGFFVAPTSAQVKAEIAAFESGTTDDDTKVYTYPTPLQMLATDSDMPVADPRKQIWPGYKAPAPAPPAPATPTTEAQPPPAPVDDGPPTVQTYLQAFAQGSNIWIMTPGSWAPESHAPPPANSSIISAVKNFVSSSNGAVTQAIILRVGRGARGGGFAGGNRGGGGGFGDMSAMDDRLRNAINGLPADAQAQALDQLNQETQFYQGVQAAAPEDRPKMIQEHMMQKMADTNPMSRMSPEKRASRMARSVAAREAVRGK